MNSMNSVFTGLKAIVWDGINLHALRRVDKDLHNLCVFEPGRLNSLNSLMTCDIISFGELAV